jgi:hypothetical protein
MAIHLQRRHVRQKIKGIGHEVAVKNGNGGRAVSGNGVRQGSEMGALALVAR